MKHDKLTVIIVLVIIGAALLGVVGFFVVDEDGSTDRVGTGELGIDPNAVPHDVDQLSNEEPELEPGDRELQGRPQGGAEELLIHELEVQNQPIQSHTRSARTVEVTNGVRHTVPLHEIVGGGPAKDGIPSIDDPKFVTADTASSFLNEQEPGLAFSQDGIDRFYPFQILVWHEIVNDVFNGERVLITYCPLCLSGIVFDPVVQGDRVEFGTSGKLWDSNLVMYDRKTDTYWSQILGEAIRGELAGAELAILPSDQIRFGDWKTAHPDGEVLSRDTGATRFYGQDPYGDYYTDDNAIIFGSGASDSRLDNKDFVLGLVIDGQAKAYYPPSIKEKGEVVDSFADRTIVARHDEALDVVRLFERAEDGTETRINPFPNFWFSWVGAHPDTALYK